VLETRKVVAGSMSTRLAFLEPVAESFQIVFLTTLESLILLLLHCVIVSSFLQHYRCCMLFVSCHIYTTIALSWFKVLKYSDYHYEWFEPI